ncbi:hypothetical protein [uncultured Megasphaera sp.]|uniref:hypothetical protein n=1 Tax=uncultured Megasphaera sp. TaxID=165188 RepID=UPI002657E4B3|nr:hypothetical protein [uncultured Megasphaera sp.]
MAVRFLRYIQQDLKWFWYMEFLLMVFRVAFLVLYSGQVSSASGADIGYALWLGLRISLKTAAVLTAVPFLLATLPGTCWSAWPAERIRLYWGCLATAVMALLFMIRIPYYQAFQSSFNIMIFNGMKDDGRPSGRPCFSSISLSPDWLALYAWLDCVSLSGINLPTPVRGYRRGIFEVLLPVSLFCCLCSLFSAVLAAASAWQRACPGKVRPVRPIIY